MKDYPACCSCAYRRSRYHCDSCKFRPEKSKKPTNWVKGKTVFIRTGASGGYYWTKPDYTGKK